MLWTFCPHCFPNPLFSLPLRTNPSSRLWLLCCRSCPHFVSLVLAPLCLYKWNRLRWTQWWPWACLRDHVCFSCWFHIHQLITHALFSKEHSDVLNNLKVAIPKYGRVIACLLVGTTIKGKSRKVDDFPYTSVRKEKSLSCKDIKALAPAWWMFLGFSALLGLGLCRVLGIAFCWGALFEGFVFHCSSVSACDCLCWESLSSSLWSVEFSCFVSSVRFDLFVSLLACVFVHLLGNSLSLYLSLNYKIPSALLRKVLLLFLWLNLRMVENVILRNCRYFTI
jgi:hypothetical protein